MFVSSLLRQTTLVVYLLSLIGMLVYAFTLNLGHLWVVFLTAGILGWVTSTEQRPQSRLEITLITPVSLLTVGKY